MSTTPTDCRAAFALGVCYYPEHWPRDRWPGYARRMRELGLAYVRIAEFAWSRMEPRPGEWCAVEVDGRSVGPMGYEGQVTTQTFASG